MSLKPLGFKASLHPSISLKQNFQSLQTSLPLGQSLNSLEQNLQLGEFWRSPLTQASFDNEDMANSWFISGSIRQEDANNSPINPLLLSPPQSSVTNCSSTNPQAKLSQDELPFQNPSGLNNGSNTTESGLSVKFLGFSQPLVQESDILICTQPNLPQVIQNKSNVVRVPNAIPDNAINIATSWSSISELLGKSFITANNTFTEDNESANLSSFSYTLSSPLISDSPNGEILDIDQLNIEANISQELVKEPLEKNDSTDNEQLDILAQKVYILMRKWLEITQERSGIKVVENPIWLSSITSLYRTPSTVNSSLNKLKYGQRTVFNSGVAFPIDTKLQQLMQKVYWLIQHRFEIERERRGSY
ncbi:MAG: hypothetical protein U7127_04935 [Phormidium sp.]